MRITLTQEEYLDQSEAGGVGYCTNCGEQGDYCEPDARNYHCSACGQDKVFGLEELLMMDLIDLEG